MPFWEQHKHITAVGLGFVGMLFVLWLFLLRGYDAEGEKLEKDFSGKGGLTEQIEQFCNAEKGPILEVMRSRFDRTNEKLDHTLTELKGRLYYKFPEPLIPEKNRGRSQSYVRVELRKLRDYVEKEISTKRNIELGEEAASLGFDISPELVETLDQDREYIRQMIVVKRFVDMLAAVPEEQDGTRPLLKISALKPYPAVLTGGEKPFILEYPVEATIHITMRGLMRLLAFCSSEKTFHVVQGIDMLSVPGKRLSQEYHRKLDEPEKEEGNKAERKQKTDQGARAERWLGHYYEVTLKLACMTAADARTVKLKTKPKVMRGPRRVILH